MSPIKIKFLKKWGRRLNVARHRREKKCFRGLITYGVSEKRFKQVRMAGMTAKSRWVSWSKLKVKVGKVYLRNQ